MKEFISILSLCLILTGCQNSTVQTYDSGINITQTTETSTANVSTYQIDVEETMLPAIPDYTGTAFVVVNNNVPFFSDNDLSDTVFETYSELDELGRCGMAYANICQDLMPDTERESIGQVKPSGWHTINYHELIDGNYLYNRCHLIGYQLAGENANEKNLITGTRYLNVEGMLPFENQIADYVKSTNHHVLYRVTPIFKDRELVCRGVLMEAQSIEDNNCVFCVYCYNVQPGIGIDYTTGDSWIENSAVESSTKNEQPDITYILNTNSKKIHRPSCSSIADMSPKNKKETNLSKDELILQGYQPCKICNP